MPESFGQYELIQKIAQGGMAEIFLAKRTGELGGFEKQVAIKRIFKHLTGREETVNMFFDEARIAATLNHPNIVQVYDLGEVDGYFYIAMEFVHGTDLRRICRRGLERDQYLPVEIAAHVVAQTAGALHYAHTRTDDQGNPRNIVHRDISPQNILLSMDGHVKICDFGIAKAENRLARTRTGQFKGKLSYMSPEQFNGEDVDARSDVFNLGIVLYEITLARRLFDAKTDFERMRQIANAHVTPPSEVREDYPPGLERIILKALRHDPDERYQTAETVQLELEDWLHERGAKVGSVEVGNYLEEVFPELADGIPENMAQVEFPADGRARSSPGRGGRDAPAGLDEPSAPNEKTDKVGPGELPADRDTGGRRGDGDVGSEDSAVSVTVDPSKQPGAGPRSSERKDPEPTEQVRVDRDEVRRVARQQGPPTRDETPVGDDPSDAAETRVTRGPSGPPPGTSSSPPEATTETDRPAVGSGNPPGERGPPSDEATTEKQNKQRLAEGSSAADAGPDGPEPGPRARRGSDPSRERRERDSRPIGDDDSAPDRREHRSSPVGSPSTDSSPPGSAGRPPSRREPPEGGRGRSPPAAGAGPPHATGGGGTTDGPGGGSDSDLEADDAEPGDDDLAPDSALQRTWQRSVELVANDDDPISNKRQRIIAYAILGGGVVGAAIYVWTALMHEPEHDIEERTAEQRRIAAKAADAAANKDEKGPDIPTVSKKVTTEPKGARLLLNGAPVQGSTPTEAPFVEGKKNELYVYKSGHEPVRDVVTPSDGALPTYELDEAAEADSGKLKVMSEPKKADVFLNGKRVGKTPVKVGKVPRKGRHYVRLEKAKHHSYFGLFEMRDEGLTRVDVQMANATGPEDDDYCEVVYDLIPQGARIKVNGEVQGTSNIAVRHTCGQYLKVVAWKKDYRQGEHYLHLRRPGKYLMRTSLEEIVRKPGRVSIDVPDDVRVFIGANGYGKGSVDGLELESGEYNAVFQGGGQRFNKTLEVEPEKTTEYEFRIDGDSATLERLD